MGTGSWELGVGSWELGTGAKMYLVWSLIEWAKGWRGGQMIKRGITHDLLEHGLVQRKALDHQLLELVDLFFRLSKPSYFRVVP